MLNRVVCGQYVPVRVTVVPPDVGPVLGLMPVPVMAGAAML